MKSLLGYNIKLLYSPLKWICCFIFTIFIPIFMYAPTYYDFTNICDIYMPFIGVTLFTDIMLIDKNSNIREILYISNSKLKKVFLGRYLIITILIIVLSFISNSVFFIQGHFNGQSYLNEPITILEFLIISLVSILFLGTLSMTIGNVLSNQYIAYVCSLIYWLYWNVNSTRQSIFNLFPFIAKPTEYVGFISIQLAMIFLLLLINLVLLQKSPFFINDKLSKLKTMYFINKK